MKVLVACEYSGKVRDAFAALGHDAWSADLLPTDVPGNHYEGDVLDILGDGWDLMVAHPPCTFLANSGVRWLSTRPERWQQMRDGRRFFLSLLNAPIARIAVENPIPHKHGKLPPYDQLIQPYNFGHDESKATCLWLRGLPPLMATVMFAGTPKQTVHSLPPSPDRWKLRSETFQGIADAMAYQWGTE